MAPIVLLRGRAWPRSASACAVVAIALLAVIIPAPATDAKNEGKKPPAAAHGGNGRGNGNGNGHGNGHGNGNGKGETAEAASNEEPPAESPAPAPGETPAPAVSHPVIPVGVTTTPSRPSGSQSPPQTRPGRNTASRRQRRASTRHASTQADRTTGARRASGNSRSNSTGSRRAGSLPTQSSDDGSRRGKAKARPSAPDQTGSPVSRTVRDIVKVVPNSVKLVLAALAALSVLLGIGSLLSTLRARRLDSQRRELLQEVGLLQRALLPPVPRTLGAIKTSVAYRPAEGPGAGGDFYDALTLPGGKAAFILGDVSGHGRGALERTAFLRYTLRAYLEAGLAPRVALQVAGRVIDTHLGGGFATVLLAVHDPETGSLTYSSAGHPAPIVVGPSAFEPVLAASSPPVNVGLRTGLRETTLPLAPGSVACLYTDGLTEARTASGILGRGRLTDIVGELGRDALASALLERVAEESRLVSDDMAVCLLTPTAGVTAGGFRTELLELTVAELESPLGERFLEACGVGEEEASQALGDAAWLATRFDRVVLHVVFGNRRTVEVLPANVESIEAAARRVAS